MRKSKKEMIQEMKDNCWNPTVDETDDYETVKEEYQEFLDEEKEAEDDDTAMFPNGRDYDAEDEDGPF